MKKETLNLNGYFAISEAEYNEYQELKKKINSIDYDMLKTGSVVMIEYNGHHCCGIESINTSKPVTILLYKTKGYLYNGEFRQATGEYITFIQDDKVCHFTAYDINYITEVISY